MIESQSERTATPQERFWQGEFGDAYIERNGEEPRFIAGNLALFSKVLLRTGAITSAVELGANIGLNLRALATLRPDAQLTGVEINARAADRLRDWGGCEVVQGSLLDDHGLAPHDLAFTKGVLIHIAPDRLTDAYDRLVASSRRWVLVAEYYNPSPVMVEYRGHDERLFKRDFAGELIDRHPQLSVVDYGFCWRRDPAFPMDDLTWFLMEKRA